MAKLWHNLALPFKVGICMASSREYVDFILEQLSDLDNISDRLMMGFRVIIMTQANSQVNTRVLELLSKFKIKKMNR